MHKLLVLLVAFVCALAPLLRADTTPPAGKDASELLRQGLFDEEANRDLDKAAADYASVIALYDGQRTYAATALFRLAEVKLQQGKKPEATALYQRVLTEFPNQDALTKLSRDRLAALGAPAPAATTAEPARGGPLDDESKLLEQYRRQWGDNVTSEFDSSSNQAPYNGQSPMSYAAGKGWTRLLTFMLQHGGRAGGENFSGAPLRAAAAGGSKEAVELLLARGALIDLQEPDGWTALHAACLNRHPEIVSLLLDKRAKTEVFSSRKPDLKTIPVHSFGYDLPKWLIAWKDIPLGSPVLIAIRNGDIDVLTRLLDHQADPDFYGEPGTAESGKLSPLLFALRIGQEAAARLLLERKARTSFATPEGFTILHAAAAGTPQLVNTLLDLGLPQAADTNGWTPLFYSVYLGGSRHEIDEAVGKQRFTPLPEFMDRLGTYERAWEALVVHGADVNAREKETGNTVLYYSAPDDYHLTEVPDWLLAHGVDINARNQQGQTPLMYFCDRHSVDESSNKEALVGVSWFMEHGADATIKDSQGLVLATKWGGPNGEMLRRKYVLPPLVAKYLGTRTVTSLVDMAFASSSPRSIEPQADFDQPPSLLLLMECTFPDTIPQHLTVEVHHPVSAGGEVTVIPVTLDFSQQSINAAKWPLLHWGDVAVFAPDTKDRAASVSDWSRAFATVKNRTISVQLGSDATPVIMADPDGNGTAASYWLQKDPSSGTSAKPKPAATASPGVPGMNLEPNEILVWTPIAYPLPSWTLSELVLHLEQGNPRVQLDGIRLERTTNGQTQTWSLDLRAVDPTSAETDWLGRPTAVKKVDVWLADGDRLIIPLRAAADNQVLSARRQGITFAAPGSLFAQRVFTRPPDDSASHTLAELLMQAYLSPMVIPNPNLSQITVHRLKGENGEEDSLPVDLTQTILKSVNLPYTDVPQMDLPLQWGDRIEIPAIQGADLATWIELSSATQAYLRTSLNRQPIVTFNGQPLPDPSSPQNGTLLRPEIGQYFPERKSFPIRFQLQGRTETGTFTALTLLRQLQVNLDTMVRFTLRQGGKSYDYDLKALKSVNPWIDRDAQVNIQQLSP